MFLAQVNYILHEFGLFGIPSSNLDFIALTEKLSTFQQTFLRRIIQSNTESTEFLTVTMWQINRMQTTVSSQTDLVYDCEHALPRCRHFVGTLPLSETLLILAAFADDKRDLLFHSSGEGIVQSPSGKGVLVGMQLQSLLLPLMYCVWPTGELIVVSEQRCTTDEAYLSESLRAHIKTVTH